MTKLCGFCELEYLSKELDCPHCRSERRKVKELDEIFYSVPQPCMLEKKWESKKKELGL